MKTLVILLSLVCIVGCGERRPSSHTVVLVDLSASIPVQSLESALRNIETLTEGMRRGDRLSIIPISSRTRYEAPGRIIRIRLSHKREAYDTDISRVRAELRDEIDKLKSDVAMHRSPGTDILGGIVIANGEIQATERVSSRLVILSDFLQDDTTYSFLTDSRLRSNDSARKLANLARQQTSTRRWDDVVLGYLRSNQTMGLSTARSNAIQAFWVAFFEGHGSRTVVYPDSNAIPGWQQQ